MWNNMFYIILLVFILLKPNLGVEYSKPQRFNTNIDFLQHEAGSISSGSNKQANMQVAQSNTLASKTQDYNSQYPSLTPKSSTTTPSTQSSQGNIHLGITRTPQSSGKRDYVAPQFPALKPAQGNNQPATGNVKNLVNFYDRQNTHQNTPTRTPSYSTILQGNNKQGTTASLPNTQQTLPQKTQSTPKISSNTPKPLSFSAVVAGSNKPSLPVSPTTRKPTVSANTPVLPSAIVNNNRNNNQASNSNTPSDAELQTLSEELLRKDANNAAKYVTVNYQEKTTSQSKEDKAPQPLLIIAPDVWNITTIQKFLPLLDNYERDTLVNEHVTPQERNEENAFMDSIMSTTVIRHLMNFFKDKGYVSPDPRQQRDYLKQLWFSLYSRGKGKISSSGFEHVFVSELKNGEVSGLHNWIYFSKEEAANRVNYLGYLKYAQLNDKGVVLKLHFNQQGVDKPVDSMFIGTSPELEIALYTLCFVTRADNDCSLKLGSQDVNIRTHTFRYRSKNLIGSAFPQI